MIGFLIKKSFFDSWDNLFRVALINIGFIISFSVPLLPFIAQGIFINAPIAAFAVLLIGALWCIIYLAAAAKTLSAISDYGSFGFADFWNNLKEVWLTGLVMGCLIALAVLLVTVVINFYIDMGNLFGLFFAAVIFWTLVTSVLSLQYFFAVRSRLDTKNIKVIKKCFFIFFDNPMFSIFLFLHNFVMFLLSFFLAFLFPGPAGILLFIDQGLRLRLLKYDWLEENPEANRRKIPWDALLIDERDRTGTRTLRNFIFPWKD